MTSIFLTARMGLATSGLVVGSAGATDTLPFCYSAEWEARVRLPRSYYVPQSAFLRAVARRDLLVRGVLGGRLLDHGIKDRTVSLVVVGDDLPRLAVPLMHAGFVGALMVLARQLDRLQHAFEAELLDAICRKIEVFKTPADLLARHRLIAELLLGIAYRF